MKELLNMIIFRSNELKNILLVIMEEYFYLFKLKLLISPKARETSALVGDIHGGGFSSD